jgi:hypothetical protein
MRRHGDGHDDGHEGQADPVGPPGQILAIAAAIFARKGILGTTVR